jgi:hypothetical protein
VLTLCHVKKHKKTEIRSDDVSCVFTTTEALHNVVDFGYPAPKNLNYVAFQYFDYERS